MDNDELPTGEELDRLLGGDVQGNEPTTLMPQVAEGDQTPPPPAEQPQQQWNPEGPGDPAKALVEKNREIAELKEAYRQTYQQALQMQQLLSDPATLGQYLAQQQAQQQAQAAQQPEQIDFSQLDPVTDPDGAFNALVKTVQQQQRTIQSLQQGIHQTTHESRFALARESARQRYQDYDETVSKLKSIEHMLNPDVFLGPNGPDLAYKLAKSFTNGQDVQQQVQQQVSAQAQRLIPTPPMTPPSLSRLPAVAPNNDAKGDVASLSFDQIEKVGVHDWYDRAIRGVS